MPLTIDRNFLLQDKIDALTTLKGVGVAIASAILYFLFPNDFPIFDVRARRALRAANLWRWSVHNASVRAYMWYTVILRNLRNAGTLRGVPLRALEKALWTWDRDNQP